jgi:hypothetical protein
VGSRLRLSSTLLLVSLTLACASAAERPGSLQAFDRHGQFHGAAPPGERASSSLALPPDAAPYEMRPVGPSTFLVKTWNRGHFLLQRGTLMPLRGLPRSRVWRADRKVVDRELRDMKELVVPDGYPSSRVRPILALNDHDVLVSLDGGTTFRKWPAAGAARGLGGLPKQSLLLSAAFWQQSAAVLDYSGERAIPGLCAALGTAHGGVFISCDGGFTWQPKSAGLPGLPAERISFHEGVRALHVDLATQSLYAGTDLGGGAYRSAL